MKALLLVAVLLSGCATTTDIYGITEEGDEFCVTVGKTL
jgi:hypothetical protein